MHWPRRLGIQIHQACLRRIREKIKARVRQVTNTTNYDKILHQDVGVHPDTTRLWLTAKRVDSVVWQAWNIRPKRLRPTYANQVITVQRDSDGWRQSAF